MWRELSLIGMHGKGDRHFMNVFRMLGITLGVFTVVAVTAITFSKNLSSSSQSA